MKTFKDTTGREWQIAVNVNSVKRVRDLAEGFDLMKVVEDRTTIDRLSNDPFILVSVLYAVCKPQADAASVSAEQFGEAMASGDVIDHASTALLADLADFFPPHRRGPMKAAIAKLKEIQTRTAAMATAKIQSQEMTEAAIAAFQKEIDRPPSPLGNSSTEVPALPEWTPALTH